MEFRKVCIIGLGYIGLPTAASFATHGVNVVGVDTSEVVLETLRRGDVHIQEPGIHDVVKNALASGRLTVANTPVEADAFIIAVPTPFFEDRSGEVDGLAYKKADMRAVTAAAEAILPFLRKGNLVVLESTSPPRTTVNLVQPILERSGLVAGDDFFLSYSPERVLPGQILRELVENARVIGGVNPASASAGRDLYSIFVRGEIILSDATTAEMVKLMENTYRDINIAIAMEFSRLAEKFNVDIWEAIAIANLHPRVKILKPGPGVGGHCISVDPWFLVESAPDQARLIHTARLVNDAQPRFVIDWIKKAIGDLGGRKVAALGLAFKPDVDDLRESPAAEVARLLIQEGADVKAFEPHRHAGLPGIPCFPTLEEALDGADVVILLVAHSIFREITPERLATLTPAQVIIDLVNGWGKMDWSGAGFVLHCLGGRTAA